MPKRVGVVSIQGDFEKHFQTLARIRKVEACELRVPGDLEGVDCAIIPGGESTTVGKLMERYGLGEALKEKAKSGMPIWGTCMGMILMAREIQAFQQYSLNLLDIEVERNAFGAQVHSFEDQVTVKGFDKPITAVFIRAPIVTSHGEGVEELAHYQEKLVAVRQGNLVGTSFHPELTSDIRFHEWFVGL